MSASFYLDLLEATLTVLSVISTVCTIVFGYAIFRRNGRSDITSGAAKSAALLSELGYIKANTDEIKAEQKEQRKTNIEFVMRLTAVEESVKQAHKRINRIEEKIDTE